jgi:hypothetical protein
MKKDKKPTIKQRKFTIIFLMQKPGGKTVERVGGRIYRR